MGEVKVALHEGQHLLRGLINGYLVCRYFLRLEDHDSVKTFLTKLGHLPGSFYQRAASRCPCAAYSGGRRSPRGKVAAPDKVGRAHHVETAA